MLVAKDEGVRAGTTAAKLGGLKAVFKKGGTTTAGNASQVCWDHRHSGLRPPHRAFTGGTCLFRCRLCNSRGAWRGPPVLGMNARLDLFLLVTQQL